jgi:hypothetical protein
MIPLSGTCRAAFSCGAPLQNALLTELRQSHLALVGQLAERPLPLKDELLADSLLLLWPGRQLPRRRGGIERLAGHPHPAVRQTVLAVAGRLHAEAVIIDRRH